MPYDPGRSIGPLQTIFLKKESKHYLQHFPFLKTSYKTAKYPVNKRT